ncbi:MAG: hypothetical protein R3D83_07335 [Caenibius sp.]
MLHALPVPKESWTAAARTAFRADKASISFRTDLWRPALAAIFLSCTVLAGKAVQAQQRSAPASLEELIPDAAVENPEGWAGGQAVADADETSAPAPDAPLDEGQNIALPWPDEVDLPPVETLEPDPGFRFAEEGFDLPPVEDTGKEVRLSSELTLVFPPSDEEFPVRKEFTSRFEALSVVEELEGARDNIALLSTRARQDEALLDRLLRNYGYYDGQILRSLGGFQPARMRQRHGPVCASISHLARSIVSAPSSLARCTPRPITKPCGAVSRSSPVTPCSLTESCRKASISTPRWVKVDIPLRQSAIRRC